MKINVLKSQKLLFVLIIGLVGVLADRRFCLSDGEPPEFIYDSQGRRDPFVPVSSRQTGEEGDNRRDFFHLGGIIWEPAGNSLAIINDTIVREGERIDEFEVIRILPNEVVLSKDGKEFRLFLREDEEDEEEK